MKKYIYFLFIGTPLFAQVGINTTTPNTSLDIAGKGLANTADGVIAPRLSKQQLANKTSGTYAAAQTGAIVYVNNSNAPTGTSPSISQVTEITTEGYYYFNGSLWKKMGDIAVNNIYTNDGNLAGNRVVTQAENTLAFRGTATNAFSVDGNTFSVDAANHRVGIGKANPQRVLDVNASNNPIRITNLETLTGAGGNTNILTVDGSGDVRRVPLNNLLAGPVSLTMATANYSASGNESVIWSAYGSSTVTLPVPSDNQVGKTLSLVAAIGTITLAGSTPTVSNQLKLITIPELKRITIFAIAKNVWGNLTNEWVVIAKDF